VSRGGTRRRRDQRGCSYSDLQHVADVRRFVRAHELFDELGPSIAARRDRHGNSEDEGLWLRNDWGYAGAHLDHPRHSVCGAAPAVQLHGFGEQLALALLGPERVEGEMQPTREPRQERRRTSTRREV